ncbi:MAG: LapA family protein [Pirellulaceae bacterium]|jgi:uncharacterized integral membrane protein|nr:LapA family protein [Pirellulaceae bacterium]
MTTASKAKWVLFLLLAVLLLIIAFQNLEVVEIRVLLWDSKLTKAVLLAITAGIGFLMGFFARTLWHVRAWSRRSKTNKADASNSSLV